MILTLQVGTDFFLTCFSWLSWHDHSFIISNSNYTTLINYFWLRDVYFFVTRHSARANHLNTFLWHVAATLNAVIAGLPVSQLSTGLNVPLVAIFTSFYPRVIQSTYPTNVAGVRHDVIIIMTSWLAAGGNTCSTLVPSSSQHRLKVGQTMQRIIID